MFFFVSPLLLWLLKAASAKFLKFPPRWCNCSRCCMVDKTILRPKSALKLFFSHTPKTSSSSFTSSSKESFASEAIFQESTERERERWDSDEFIMKLFCLLFLCCLLCCCCFVQKKMRNRRPKKKKKKKNRKDFHHFHSLREKKRITQQRKKREVLRRSFVYYI